MEIPGNLALAAAFILCSLLFAYLYWRYFWFFRNPDRNIPDGENILSPADGTVVYVKRVGPDEPVVSIKKDKSLCLGDMVRQDLNGIKVLIGVFMSPLDVHYNRVPMSGMVELIRHQPAKPRNYHMFSMHWRSLMRRLPIYEKSPHIIHNERTVTRIKGVFRNQPISCYVVQIAGGSVNGIDSYVREGALVEKGHVFGMIRIGSQVDVIITWRETMNIKVRPGEKVRAGETIFVE